MQSRLVMELLQFVNDNMDVLVDISEGRSHADLHLEIRDGCIVDGGINLKFRRRKGASMRVLGEVPETTH